MNTLRNYFVLLLILVTITGYAQETYEDSFGGFAIDLHDGMKPTPKTNDAVLGLKNGRYRIIIQMNQQELDVEKAYAFCVENLLGAGMAEMEQKVGHQKMLVNGNAARMGTYESTFETDGVEVSLIGVAFAIALEQNTLSVLTIMAPKVYKNSLKEFENTVFSIRSTNQKLTGTSQVEDWDITLEEVKNSIPEKEVATTVVASTEPTPASFGGISFILPPGWAEQPRTRSDGENIIGKLEKSSEGVSGMVMGLKGLIWNKKRVNQVALDVGKQVFPSGNLEKALEINLDNKKKATLYKHTGIAVAEGKEIPMASISLVQKVGKQYLIHIMTMPAGPTEAVEQDMIAIANSAK